MSLDFQIAGGSVAGRDHRQGIPRNRQDAFRILQTADYATVVVADGCGSSETSEVGASIGVELMTTFLHRQLARGYPPSEQLLQRAGQEVLSMLHVLAKDMGESLSQVVNQYFLFTLNGMVASSEATTFFAHGDGMFVINGEQIVLDSGPNNAPRYLAYAMLGQSAKFDIVRTMETAALQNFAIGSDGVLDAIRNAERCMPGSDEAFGPLSQFWENDRYFEPGSIAITRRLNLLARDWPRTDVPRYIIEGGLLPDDTTLIVGRRPPTATTKEE